MEKVVVSDTNIFIDLCKLGILGDFFALPLDIHTTDLIISELTIPEQKQAVLNFQKREKLHVASLDASQISEVAEMSADTNGKLSIYDCSVWLYARTGGYSIISGDDLLKRKATEDGLEVHGILYIIDLMVNYNILPKPLASSILSELYKINKWLPKAEVERRINNWK